MAGTVLFYGGLAADVLLLAGIAEQLVARLAAGPGWWPPSGTSTWQPAGTF